MTDKRVVITGIGIYSCIGKNINEVTNSLKEGKSGIGIDSVRREMGYRSTLTGIIDIPNLKGVLSRRQRVSLAEEAIYAYVSTKEALENAKIDDDFLDNNIIGMIFGNDSLKYFSACNLYIFSIFCGFSIPGKITCIFVGSMPTLLANFFVKFEFAIM